MGGKQSKNKKTLPSTSSFSFLRFKSKSKLLHKSNKKKLRSSKSASNLPVDHYATPYSQEPQPREKVIEYKLYRSYTDIRQPPTTDESPKVGLLKNESPNIKVFRKSLEADRFESLLRDEKNKNQTESYATVQMPKKNMHNFPANFNTISTSRHRNNSLSRNKTSSSFSLQKASSFRKSYTRLSVASIGYEVTVHDMPSTTAVKKKTRQFESFFVRRLSDLIDTIPLDKLIKQVIVGVIQLPNGTISTDESHDRFYINIERFLLKYDYLEKLMNSMVSPDLIMRLKKTLQDGSQKNLADGSLEENEMSQTKKSKFSDQTPINQNSSNNLKTEEGFEQEEINRKSKRTTGKIINVKKLGVVLKQIINGYLIAISKELSRIYEYQIALISDGLSLDLVSRYAADCVIDFLEYEASSLSIFHVDSAVHAVVWRNLKPSKLGNSTISVLIGEKELKWRIDEIFRKPGLRLDTLLYTNKLKVEQPEEIFWKYYSHECCDFLLYGYRGPVVDRSSNLELHRLHKNEFKFDSEVEWMEDDFHRYYIPYRKLIGKKVIEMYDKVIETKIPINRNLNFSTPKHNLSENYEQNLEENLYGLEADDLSDQILSLNSFVQVLLGNDTRRQETEVLCKYIDNEKAIRKHFRKLTSRYEKNMNNNNSNDENLTDTQDYTREFDDSHHEESFALEEMDYTREHEFFQDSILNNNNINSSSDQHTSSINNDENSKSSNTQQENENVNTRNQKPNTKEFLKYSLTPIENQHMVSKDNKLTMKQLNGLKLEDLYNHSSSFSNENTTTSACLNCCEMSEDAKTSEDGSECFSSPTKELLYDNNNYFDEVSKDVNDFNERSGLIEKSLYEYSRERSYDSLKKSQNTTKSSLASDV